ncbi:MAG: methionine biosynthesis protein MetW [Spirochaetia bacterium]|nr:methionine biosynthesis protein MetW [Spirochaetia bacterium]
MLGGIYESAFKWIPEKSRVLDLGAGDGGFLERLVKGKKVKGEAVEKDPEMLARCIERGLVVHQGDVMDGLDQHDSDSFDYILLMGTLQELVSPANVLHEAFRVGQRVIVGYDNFAYWRIRLQIMFGGRAPVTNTMPYSWYESPNLHVCSVDDFQDFCKSLDFVQLQNAYYTENRKVLFMPNLFAEEALALIEKKK